MYKISSHSSFLSPKEISCEINTEEMRYRDIVYTNILVEVIAEGNTARW